MNSTAYPLHDERQQFSDSTFRLTVDLVKLDAIVSHGLDGKEELTLFQEHLEAHRVLLARIEQMLSGINHITTDS